MQYVITLSFVILDFITGIVKALYKKEFTSSLMRTGLYHKSCNITCMILGAMVDYANMELQLDIPFSLTKMICIYIVLMETGSIIENLGIINPNSIPDQIKKRFGKLDGRTKESEE